MIPAGIEECDWRCLRSPVRFDSFWNADAWSFSGMRSRPPSEAGQKCSHVLVGWIAEGELPAQRVGSGMAPKYK